MQSPERPKLRFRRVLANFALRTCGVASVCGGRVQRVSRTALDEIEMEKFRQSNPCESFPDRESLFANFYSRVLAPGPVDDFEFGVFRGDFTRFRLKWLSRRHADCRVFGFDSFEGLSEGWRGGQDAGHFSVNGQVPDISDPRVTFFKGWFDDTIPKFIQEFSPRPNARSVLVMDADLYSSTMLALVLLMPVISPGTFIYFDEFYDRNHEFRALMDWQRICRDSKPFRVVGMVGDFQKVLIEILPK